MCSEYEQDIAWAQYCTMMRTRAHSINDPLVTPLSWERPDHTSGQTRQFDRAPLTSGPPG